MAQKGGLYTEMFSTLSGGGEVLFWDRRYLCCVRHRRRKENPFEGVTRSGDGYSGKAEGDFGGPVALYMHTEFEVSTFSRSGDMRVITDRIADRQNDRHYNRIQYCLLRLYRRAEA